MELRFLSQVFLLLTVSREKPSYNGIPFFRTSLEKGNWFEISGSLKKNLVQNYRVGEGRLCIAIT